MGSIGNGKGSKITLNENQLHRYQRQVILPEIGEEGQEKILASKVLIVGAGGLGSAVSYYLCAAGVGKIGLMDNDKVEVSNLQRQILHHTGRIGMPKVISAIKTLNDLNPEVEVIAYEQEFGKENAVEFISKYDLVVDCSDNFPTRYALNEFSVRLKKALFYGAISGFEGQAMTIIPGQGPCYQCLYPEPPDPEVIPGQQNGVLGILPGVIGVIQAAEVLKYILGIGNLLLGKLLLCNMLENQFRKLTVGREFFCPACGKL